MHLIDENGEDSSLVTPLCALTSLLDADQHSVQMRFQLVLQQLQAQDSDGTQCIDQTVCAERNET